MVTFTDIIVLMLAYAGLSLSGICLIWQLKTKPPSGKDRARPIGAFLSER
jgi:hypothetical protein